MWPAYPSLYYSGIPPENFTVIWLCIAKYFYLNKILHEQKNPDGLLLWDIYMLLHYILELRELLGLEPVSLMIKKSRLRWFGHVERKDDNDWVKRCVTWEVEGIRQRGRQKRPGDCVRMTWKVWAWGKRMRSPGINGGELSGQLASMAVKTVCVRVCVCVWIWLSHIGNFCFTTPVFNYGTYISETALRILSKFATFILISW